MAEAIAAAQESTPQKATEAKAAGAPNDKAEGAEASASLAPIIVKKIIDEGHGGAHGGAWKIALADMMTAMMAFFLLMWLLGATNTDQRKAIADYFKPTAMTQSALTVNTTSGSTGLMGGQSIIDETALPQAAAQTGLMQVLQPRDTTGNRDSEKDKGDLSQDEKSRIASELDKANFEKLEKELQEKLSKDKELSNLKENVVISREKEGLRIDIIDKADFTMFGLGNSKLTPKSQGLIEEIARSLAGMPNKIKVRGHTDALVFKGGERNNWSLSAERADVTRQILIQKGIDEKRITRIEGVADTEPFVASDPLDPRNRRISVTVQYRE